jgi:hypothetical protein
MEDEDELVAEPDQKGFLSLTNRAWIHLDPVIWTMVTRIVSLDLSYNNILEIPSNIGELQVMREFKCSFNKLKELPPEIGRIKRLRKLYVNGNQLESLPTEIGRLEMLEELIVSENELQELPRTISLMSALRVLRLQNNKLRVLPYEIASIQTLEDLNCSNNDTLLMVPPKWRSHTESVMFVCTIHRDYQVKMEEINRTNDDLTKHSQLLEQEQLKLAEKNEEYKFQLDELRKNIPKKVMDRIERDAKAAVEDSGGAKKKKGADDCVIS